MSENLLAILPGLEVSSEDVREAEAFAIQYLSSLYPTVDFRPGLATYDMAIRPTATLIALLQKANAFVEENRTLSAANNDTPEDAVDRLLSNLFVARRGGSTTKVQGRLYFLQRRSLTISTSYFFSPDNVRRYYPTADVPVAAESMQSATEQSAIAPFYVDLELEAEAPSSEFDEDTGSLLYFTNFDPYFIGGEIRYLKSNSVSKETNEEFIARAEHSISTRNLINNPSIQERLTTLFGFIKRVTPVGMSDEQMLRDLRKAVVPGTFTEAVLHTGGHVDVYVDAPVTTTERIPVYVDDYEGLGFGFMIDGPILDYETVFPPAEDPENIINDPNYSVRLTGAPKWAKAFPPVQIVGYTPSGDLVNDDYAADVGFSSKQKTFVAVPAVITLDVGDGQTIPEDMLPKHYFYITTTKFFGLESIQAYLEDSASRVVCADYLARAMDLYSLDIVFRVADPFRFTPSTLLAQSKQYVDGLYPGDPFSVTDLLHVIRQESGVGSAAQLSAAPSVGYAHRSRNGTITVGLIEDIMDIDRLSRFYVRSVTIEPLVINSVP
jgi:hypothetical protein